jgi:hypothetical protein
MAKKYGMGSAAVQELVAWYRQSIDPLDRDPLSRQPWAFGSFSNGTPINRAHRVIYRIRPDLQQAFPDPFETNDSGRSGYLGWCRRYGRIEYPGFLPAPGSRSDWTRLGARPEPTLVALADLPPRIGLREHLRLTVREPGYANRLWQQASRVHQREGLAGIWRRVLGLLR